MSETTSLWNEYNLQHNPDPASGILYAIHYSAEHLAAMRDIVAGTLEARGIGLAEHPEGIAVIVPPETDEAQHKNIELLFEELTVINEAAEYQEREGLDRFESVADLCGALSAHVSNGGVEGPDGLRQVLTSDNKADFYNLVTVHVPEIIMDLRVSHDMNQTLTRRDLAALESLEGACRFYHHILEGKARPNILLGA